MLREIDKLVTRVYSSGTGEVSVLEVKVVCCRIYVAFTEVINSVSSDSVALSWAPEIRSEQLTQIRTEM